MKNIYKFYKSSQTPQITPTVKRFSSGSGMVSLSEYTSPNAKSFSESDGVKEDLSSKVTELSAKVDQLTELVSKLMNTKSAPVAGEVKTGSAEETSKTENNQPNDEDSAATGNEATNEEAKGAEVPGNTGTYTKVPEDEIISQFSRRVSGKSSIVIPSLGNKDQFNVLYK